MLRRHAQLNAEYFGESLGIARLRKCMAAYTKDMPFAAEFRGQAYRHETLQALLAAIDNFEARMAESTVHPPA